MVGLGEPHQSRQFHEFLKTLVTTPSFIALHPTIIVEFGNARYQSIADAYVAGSDVPKADVEKIWRNTTQLLVWDAPMYEGFFHTIREVNRKVPEGSRLRVLLGDPPIDWSAIRTPADFPRAYGYRDWFYADVVERKVLDKHRRGLLIMGSTH